MKKLVISAVVLALGFAVVSFAEEAAAPAAAAPVAAAVEKVAAPAPTSMFVCPKCCVAAAAAGKCEKCGAEMQAMKVLTVKDGATVFCACPADCKCTLADDGAKCSCGKDVVKVPAKAPAAPAEKK
jgi:hypothetical protein